MARDPSELTDEQGEKIAPFFPAPKASPWGGPKPLPNRPCFEGLLGIWRMGARWKDLPARYPSPSTCWRRLRDWEEQDLWLTAWRTFLGQWCENLPFGIIEVSGIGLSGFHTAMLSQLATLIPLF